MGWTLDSAALEWEDAGSERDEDRWDSAAGWCGPRPLRSLSSGSRRRPCRHESEWSCTQPPAHTLCGLRELPDPRRRPRITPGPRGRAASQEGRKSIKDRGVQPVRVLHEGYRVPDEPDGGLLDRALAQRVRPLIDRQTPFSVGSLSPGAPGGPNHLLERRISLNRFRNGSGPIGKVGWSPARVIIGSLFRRSPPITGSFWVRS